MSCLLRCTIAILVLASGVLVSIAGEIELPPEATRPLTVEWHIIQGNVDAVRGYLAGTNRLEQSYLLAAVAGPRLEVLQALLDQPYVDLKDETVRHSLHLALASAVKNGRVEAVQLLLKRGVSVDADLRAVGPETQAKRHEIHYTPLVLALEYGQVKMTEFLIETGAEIDLKVKGKNIPRKWNPITRLEHDFTPHLLMALAIQADQPEFVAMLFRRVPTLRFDLKRRYIKTGQSMGLYIRSRAMVETLLAAGVSLHGDDMATAGGVADNGTKEYTTLVDETLLDIRFGQKSPNQDRKRDVAFLDYLLKEKKLRLMSQGSTELFGAILGNDTVVLKKLLDHQKAVDLGWFTTPGRGIHSRPGKRGQDVLCDTVHAGHFDLATVLLEYGADAKTTCEDGDALITEAVSEAPTDFIRLLLKRGADPNSTYAVSARHTRHPIVVAAARSGRFDTAQLLVEAGARTDFVDTDGETLLHVVAHADKPSKKNSGDGVAFAQWLLRQGRAVNVADKKGETPLSQAVWGGNPGMVTLLCRAGADLTVRIEDKSLVQNAVLHDRPAALQALLECGAKDPAVSPLTIAVLSGTEQELAVQIEAATPAQRNDALVVAVSLKRSAAARQLLTSGADPNTPDREFSPPDPVPLLRHAIENKDLPLLQILLEAGANPNTQFRFLPGNVLALAAQGKQPEMVKALLERGAKPVPEALRYIAFEAGALLPLVLQTLKLDPATLNGDQTRMFVEVLSLTENRYIYSELEQLRKQQLAHPEAGVATLVRAIVKRERLVEEFSTKASDAVARGDLAALESYTAFVPEPGQFRFITSPLDGSDKPDPNSERVAQALERALEPYRMRVEEARTLENIAQWAYRNNKPALAARYFAAYPKLELHEQTARALAELAARHQALVAFAKAYPALDRCLALKVAAAEGDVAALKALTAGVDMKTCLRSSGVGHRYLAIEPGFPEGVLAVVDWEAAHGRPTLEAVLALDPHPADVALAARRAATLGRFEALQRLYATGRVPRLDTLKLDPGSAGYRAVELMQAGVTGSQFTQDMFVAVASDGQLRTATTWLDTYQHAGASVNKLDSTGRLALDWASASGRAESFQWLVEHGADPRLLIDALGHDFWWTSRLGVREAERLLASAKDSAPFKESALANAARLGRTDVVDFLLARGATGTVVFENREYGATTALGLASHQGALAVVERLLGKSSYPIGWRADALQHAIDQNQVDCARALLSGVDRASLKINMQPASAYARAHSKDARMLELFR